MFPAEFAGERRKATVEGVSRCFDFFVDRSKWSGNYVEKYSSCVRRLGPVSRKNDGEDSAGGEKRRKVRGAGQKREREERAIADDGGE